MKKLIIKTDIIQISMCWLNSQGVPSGLRELGIWLCEWICNEKQDLSLACEQTIKMNRDYSYFLLVPRDELNNFLALTNIRYEIDISDFPVFDDLLHLTALSYAKEGDYLLFYRLMRFIGTQGFRNSDWREDCLNFLIMHHEINAEFGYFTIEEKSLKIENCELIKARAQITVEAMWAIACNRGSYD